MKYLDLTGLTYFWAKIKAKIDGLTFYIPISSSNTTTVTWEDVYTAHTNNAIIVAKIDYVENGATIPVAVPLYTLLGNQSGGTVMFTFVLGTSTITYMVTGTGSNTCTVIKQSQNFELISNKSQDITSNSTSETLYPSTKAVFDQFQRKPVTVWEVADVTQGLIALNANISSSLAWQLTSLDLTPYKRIKIYAKAGRKTGSLSADSSIVPAVIVEMLLDDRAKETVTQNVFLGSALVQNPNDANRLGTLTCAVSADKTKFAVLRQTSIYGTAATSNTDTYEYVFLIEGYYD